MTDFSGYLRIGAGTTDIVPDTDACAEFAAMRSLVCCDAIAPEVFAGLVRLLGRSAFVSNTVSGMGHREIEAPERVGTAIRLLLNRAPLFRWLEAVTGCDGIATADGRVVQTHARPGDELVWHDDMEADRDAAPRRLGITIALDSPAYTGGEFEMRRVRPHETLRRFRHDAPGTALIFEVAPDLEHRVLPLLAGGPRRVFTGWFIG